MQAEHKKPRAFQTHKQQKTTVKHSMSAVNRKSRGFQATRRRKVALVISSIALIEMVIILSLLLFLIWSSVFGKFSLIGILIQFAAVGCVGVSILAGKRLYLAFTWKSDS